MNIVSAIEVINRRAVTLRKLFGVNSAEYARFTAEMSLYDTFASAARHAVQLHGNKTNRALYRELIPWAKRIQKTPYSVLKRKAEKRRKAIDDILEDDNEFFGEDIKDYDTYNKWLNDFNDYFEACYELAVMNGYTDAYEKYNYAEYLYNDRPAFIRQWNYFFTTGAFKEYESKYEESMFYQQYNVDKETGEVTEKPNFYRDYDEE